MEDHNSAAPANPNAKEDMGTAEFATVGTLKTEKTEKTEGHHVEATWNPKQPEAQMINGVKVYPTSYIPAKAELHVPKKMLVEFQDWHIEAVHIAIFLTITIGLFIAMWKRPNLR